MFSLLLGLAMALGYDAPPHRPAPIVRQQADVSSVKVDSAKAANVMKLLLALRSANVDPSVEREVGPGFADTLAVLAGGMPTRVQSADFGDKGDFFPTSKQVVLSPFYPGAHPPTSLNADDRGLQRGVLSHEFGHVLDDLAPELQDEFLRRNPNFPAKIDKRGGHGTLPEETFADAFSTAVSRLAPNVQQPQQYPTSDYLINARQQALLDSLVQARAKLLPR